MRITIDWTVLICSMVFIVPGLVIISLASSSLVTAGVVLVVVGASISRRAM